VTRGFARLVAALGALMGVQCAQPTTATFRPSPGGMATAGGPLSANAAADGPRAPGEPAPAPPIQGAVGSARPTTFEAAAADRRWLLFCQATRDSDGDGRLRVSLGQYGELNGDELELYLGLAGAEPEPVDAFWGADPSERWLVVKQADNAVLIDTSQGRRLVLESENADLGEIGDTALPHRALAFDTVRQRLVFSREAAPDGFEIHARSLADFSDTLVKKLNGRLWRMRTSHDSQWLVVERVVEDTTKNGRLDLPAPTVPSKPRCHGPVRQFAAWLPTGDALTTTIISLATGHATDVDDLAAPFGARFLFRDRGGALWLGDGKQKQRLANRECGAQVIHADPDRGLVVAGCSGPKPLPEEEASTKRAKKREPPRTRWPLRLLGRGLDLDLGLDLGPTGYDRWPEGSPRLFPLHAGAATRLLDMETHRLVEVEPRTFVVATYGTRALLLEQSRLTLLDVGKNEKLLELDAVAHAPRILTRGQSALVSPYVIDLAKGALLGRVDSRVLALSAEGYVLEAEGAPEGAETLALGPLAWRSLKTR